MKFNYYGDTDSLYIDLAERTSVQSREISTGVVLDYDAEGNLIGIDIDNASRSAHSRSLHRSGARAALVTGAQSLVELGLRLHRFVPRPRSGTLATVQS
jgi:uncharacterized protein YuzE